MTIRIKTYYLCFVAVAILFLSGCVAAASMPSLMGYGDVSVPNKGDFIELKDGVIIEGTISNESMRLGSNGLFKTGSVTINGRRYAFGEIVAVQKDKRYYRKDAYNAFDERIVKGRINGYMSSHYASGTKVIYESNLYYLQKGDAGPIVAYELKVLKKMIEDFQPAVDEYGKYEALSKREKRVRGEIVLNNVITIYNK